MGDTDIKMDKQELKAYRRQQAKLVRAAEKEREVRQQLESTRAPRTAKTKALGEKVWLPGKRPSETNVKEPTVQKKPKTQPASKKQDTSSRARADVSEDEMESRRKQKKKPAVGEPLVSLSSTPLTLATTTDSPPHKTPSRCPQAAVESDSSSLSEPSSGDDDEMAGDDDDSHFQSMTDDQLASFVSNKATILVNGKSPNTSDRQNHPTALDLFSIPDAEIDIVRLCAPSRASSLASGPPTSDYNEHFENDNEDRDSDDVKDNNGWDEGNQSGDESVASLVSVPKRRPGFQRGEKGKIPSKREEKFEREQPKIKPAFVENGMKASVGTKQSSRSSKSDADDNTKWPKWTHIVYTMNTKPLLLQQHQVVRGILRHAIELAGNDLITKMAWPELETSRESYRHQILYRGAKAMEKDNSRTRDVKERVKVASMKYSSVLGDLVMDCLSLARSPARAAALSHIACFELGVEEACQQHVSALLTHDLYIYPGSWKTQEQEEKNEKMGVIEKRRVPVWVISDHSLIYQNKGFMSSLKEAFFEKKGSFSFKHLNQFKSTLDGRKDPELTIPLVALGATGFYAALHGWSSGSLNRKEKFEGEIFNTVFERHVKYLKQIKEDNHVAFHVIMSRLYTYVIKNSTNKGQKSTESNALSVVDLSGYE